MNNSTLNELHSYAVHIRRKIHEYPEIGFDLDRTVALVSAELEAMGISYTYRYGKCSVVADLGQGERLLAIRADMDALPIDEKTDLPYASKIPGAMHACGHDSHTAVLLAVARYLKENEGELPCRIRLIFQPSEEGAISGAKMMVDNGVMDGVDCVLCTHCENALDAGNIGVCYGDYMAACIPATIRFFGKSTHAALPEFGIDAIAMAAEAYAEMKAMVAREANGTKYIWSVGRFSGGHVHNVVASECELAVSFRFYDHDFAARVGQQVHKICDDVAKKYGGRVEMDWRMSCGSIYNDKKITADFESITKNAGMSVLPMPPRMSSEDFAWFLEKTPGMIFRFGTRNEALGYTALAHRCDFRIDEDGMKAPIQAFCEFATKCYQE